MPLIDYDDPAVWDSITRLHVVDPATGERLVVGESRDASFRPGSHGLSYVDIVINCYVAMGLTPAQTIVIAGAGFGYVPEEMQRRGWSHVAGYDTSSYTGTRRVQDESADFDRWLDAAGITDPGRRAWWKTDRNAVIGQARSGFSVLPEDARTNGSRRAILQSLGITGNNKADWVVSEAMLESLSDAEAVQASAAAHQMATNVGHALTPLKVGFEQDPRLNWKTLAQWKALLPNDVFVDLTSGAVL